MQNRVNPFGEIIETKARGLWMGNRGHIHGDNRKIVRPFKLKAWITCRLEFKNRHREIMAHNLYTELFFLDEATAFVDFETDGIVQTLIRTEFSNSTVIIIAHRVSTIAHCDRVMEMNDGMIRSVRMDDVVRQKFG